MERNDNFFCDNFRYMLDCLYTTPYHISAEYEKFCSGEEHQFQFREGCEMPSRSSLQEYKSNQTMVVKRKAVLQIVQFFNDNLGRNVLPADFVSKKLEEERGTPELDSLIGDYYGLFLNPNRDRGEREKRFCAGVLRIRKGGTECASVLRVQMAAEIHEEKLLFDSRIPALFEADDPARAFADFREGLTGSGRTSRLSYFEGTVTLSEPVVVFSLQGSNMPKCWQIHLEFGKMLRYLREVSGGRERVSYKAGMAGALVTNDRTYRTYFMKFGLLSTRFKGTFRLNDREILRHLGVGKGSYGVMGIDEKMDLDWYEFVRESLERKQTSAE